MIGSSTLSAIAFLATVSGLPGLNNIPTPATKEYSRAKAAAVAADTLPLPWRPSWRLALENSFVQAGLQPIGDPNGPIKLQTASDPRRLQVEVDPDSGTFRSSIEVGDVSLGTGYRKPLSQFARDYAAKSFHDRWLANARQNVNSLGSATPVAHTGLSLPIPVHLPSKLTSILGPGGPALNVSGSESIRLSGTSNWTNQTLGVIGQRQSLFPSLDMQQDLDIRLEGQLSDRVKVNLLQNSANQVPLANRIAINYRGDEDDFVQELDLGNTNLSLPGTQYVSYSGKNEGLFGIKFSSRIGALDFTGLASKQEGRSERATYTGGSSVSKPPPFTDLDWVKGQYFFLYDPNFGTIYNVDEASIRLYFDDANSGNDHDFTRGYAVIDPDHAMILPLRPSQDSLIVRGNFDLLNPGPDQQYEVLKNLYRFNDTLFMVIRLKTPIPYNQNQTLAVTYTAKAINGLNAGQQITVGGRKIDTGPDAGAVVMKLLRVPRNLQTSADGINFDTTAAFAPVRELELKNIYNLGGFQIDPKSFKLQVQSGQNDPPIVDLGGVPFVEMLGLDTWKETTNQPAYGQDGVVDATGYNTQTRSWVDYDNGTLFLPDLLPFAPRSDPPNARFFDAFLSRHLNRRGRLDGVGTAVNTPNPGAYELYNPQQLLNAKFYFNAEFAAARSGSGDITLGRGNILDNSEAVVVNGERWVRDRDYTIDYDLGRVTLKRQLGPTDQLAIDYSYAPLFAQASKTLIGSAFSLQGRDKSFGGAFLYQSTGAQDIRPRLGEEPSQTLITDLNTEWHFKPSFLTRLADHLPGVRTTTPSEFNIQAEAGMSFPNPNTKNEVYIDDMEGVRDAVSLAMTPDHWRWSSVPKRATAISLGNAVRTESFLADPNEKYTEVHWYVPVNSSGSSHTDELVKEKDLRPKLTQGQGSENLRTVLAVSIPTRPPGFVSAAGDTMWTGLTYSLDQVGIDLSRSQFIEVWVSDWNDHHQPGAPFPRVRGKNTPGSGVKIHLDLGRVSEDQMRAPNRPPNEKLDTEDRNHDNQLVVIGGDSEDTGLDGIMDAEEIAEVHAGTLEPAQLTTASDSDPEGDDYRGLDQSFSSAMDPRRYLHTNGTEGNKDAYPIPDTEDLNLNGIRDTTEAYFEYTIDLADPNSPYLAADVLRDYGKEPSLGIDPTKNGWRRYRIPISDSLRVRFGTPDLTIAQHLRMWIDGMQYPEAELGQGDDVAERPLLMIGGLDIVGSRWQTTSLTPRQDSLQTTVTLDAVNSVDNAEYVAPFDPGTTRNGPDSFVRREQSIALEFASLFPGDTLEAFRTFSLPEDYSRYGTLRWFATGFGVKDDYVTVGQAPPAGPGHRDPGADFAYLPSYDSLFYFVRFASDNQGQSYYEIKRRVSQNTANDGIAWEEVAAEMAKLSQAKLDPGFPQLDPILYHTALDNGDSLILKGRPSFTRLLRISIGVVNHSTTRKYTGQLWFDELRATDVARDVGVADRVYVNGRVANLFDYNVAWNSRDANFLSVGDSRGSGSKVTSLTVATHFSPERFFEGTGIQLPISYTQNENVSQPRFSAGDDIVRTGQLSNASETRNIARTLSANYSRVWSDRSNPFLRYTLGGITANINRTTTEGHAPTGFGTSFSTGTSTSAAVSYQVALRPLASIPMPLTRARLFLLPERFYWNYGVSQTEASSYTRLAVNDSIVPSVNQQGRAAGVNFGADARPVDLLTYHVEGQRNLALSGVHLEKLGFINFGRLTGWRQSFGSHVAVGPSWFKPSFGWSSNYNQTNDIQSADLGNRLIGNGTDLTVNLDMPFDRLAGVGSTSPARPPTPGDTTQKKSKPPRRLFRPLRNLLSRLGPISTDGRIGRTSSYSSVSGTASPLYLVGLAENPGFDQGRVFAQPGNVSASGIDWRGNAHTTIPLAFGASLLARASAGDRTSNLNGVKTRSRDWRFPDIEVQYGNLASLLGLTKILDSPQLRSAYARNNSVDYQNSRTVISGTSHSDDFRPLFSIRGRLRNGTDADFRLERRSSVQESFQLGSSQAVDQTTDINLSLSRSYSQGQKVNILGKTTTVKTNVSLSLTTVYSRQKGGVKVLGFSELANPVDRTQLSVNGTGSYGFSSNVTGDLSLGFSHFRETSGIIRRSIRVEMRGQFRF